MTNGLSYKEDDVGKTQKVKELILSDPWCDVGHFKLLHSNPLVNS